VLVPTADSEVPFSILANIRSQLTRLPAGEARVAQVILEQPYSAIGWSAQELAEQAETSSPTVVRACRRLGFGGLPELRLALAREVGWSRLAPEASGADPGSALASMFSTALRSVESMGQAIDPAAFAEAATAMAGANRLLFVCAGPTQVVCRDALFDLVSIGRPAEFVDDPIVQRLLASRLAPGDVCVAIGVSGENELTIAAAAAAADAGATLITVTSSPRSTLGRMGTVGMTLAGAESSQATHGTAALVSMILLFRALASSLAGDPVNRLAPLSQIIGIHSTSRRHGR
jgi:RpiR family carbohydrate utilization transcriptional regulator